MQANSTQHSSIEMTPLVLGATSRLVDGASGVDQMAEAESTHLETEPTCFHGTFTNCMEMYVDARTVSQYLDTHRDWFARCAHPMTCEPIGENGYALTVGRFGAFGYDVEPKVGLDLLPQDQGIYRIQTIPVPGYVPPGYDVDFRAALHLVEVDLDRSLFAERDADRLPSKVTHVQWDLDLKVLVQFPRFIQALPKSLVQSTGDRLLNQIVRQVSRRLTPKVQEDFHNTLGVPFPKKRRKAPWQRGHEAHEEV